MIYQMTSHFLSFFTYWHKSKTGHGKEEKVFLKIKKMEIQVLEDKLKIVPVLSSLMELISFMWNISVNLE